MPNPCQLIYIHDQLKNYGSHLFSIASEPRKPPMARRDGHCSNGTRFKESADRGDLRHTEHFRRNQLPSRSGENWRLMERSNLGQQINVSRLDTADDPSVSRSITTSGLPFFKRITKVNHPGRQRSFRSVWALVLSRDGENAFLISPNSDPVELCRNWLDSHQPD